MKLKLGSKELVARAEREIETLTPGEVNERIGKEDVLLIDVRDYRELKKEGKIAGSINVPRGLLEFWIDPDSPYYKDFFDQAEEIIFHCALGLRSALAAQTVRKMGFENVSHMGGGFSQWVEDIGQVESVEK
ncbi:MAG: rhodanese-like domain-containing protein [Gammaproteobacteria bacterium]|jgi:rhodanese-related sulfurtransferase|nr:rhodanese [Chromatiales bacterium]MDP6673459.1 rhodanese-like domain-containing protein [Gammaproteobacteria bacterium]